MLVPAPWYGTQMATRDGDGVNRYDRYAALKTCFLRLGWHSFGDNPSERAMERGTGVGVAWDRVGRLIYPCAGDYPIRREVQP